MTGTLPKVGISCTLRQEPAQTLEFVHYHLNTGIDHIALFLDNPDDPALPELTGHPRITLTRCTPEYWQDVLGRQPEKMAVKQHTNFRVAAGLLRSAGVDWFVSLDADELLYARRSVASALRWIDRRYDLVKVLPWEAVHVDGEARTQVFWPRWFRRRRFGRRSLAGWLLLDPALAGLTRDGFFGHHHGKTFVRATAEVDSWRQHRPHHSSGALQRVTCTAIHLLHFDCLSFGNWRAKWVRRLQGGTRAVNIAPNRKAQEEAIRRAMEDADPRALEGLYRRWYCLSRMRAHLMRMAGFLSRLDLDPALFQAAAPGQNRP